MGDDAGPTEDEFEEEAEDGTPFWAQIYFLRSSVTVVWVILSSYKITFELEETWKTFLIARQRRSLDLSPLRDAFVL